MRKIFAYCLALIIVVCCFTAAASAAAGPRFTIDDVTAARGEQIKLVVNISENTGISATKLTLTVPETEDGDPVFVIDKMKQGEWSEGNQAVSRTDWGIYNWAYLEENTKESGEFAVFTVTVSPDAEPGDYTMTLTGEEIIHDTGKTGEDGKPIFEDYDGFEITAILTVTEEKAPDNSGSVIVVPGDKNECEVDTPDNGSDKASDTENGSEQGSGDSSTEDSSSGSKAGADISSNGKTIIRTSSSTGSSSDTSSESGKKDSTAKTGFFEGQHFYLMICLIAAALLLPVVYQIKKRIAKS